MKLEKTLKWICIILCVLLLTGSFPADRLWGGTVSSVMRIAGFVLLFIYSYLNYRAIKRR